MLFSILVGAAKIFMDGVSPFPLLDPMSNEQFNRRPTVYWPSCHKAKTVLPVGPPVALVGQIDHSIDCISSITFVHQWHAVNL